MKSFNQSKWKLLILTLLVAFSGTACSKKKKHPPVAGGPQQNYYGPNTSCASAAGYGGAYQGFAVADLGRGGAVIELDMFTMPNGSIYAAGELYIPNLNEFDPAAAPGASIVECVEGSGTFVFKSGFIGDEVSMTLKGNLGTTIIMGGTSSGMRADTIWVNDSITGQLHMSLGGQPMLLYTLSP